MAADVCRTFLWENAHRKTRREINTHKHTVVSQAVSSLCVCSYLVSCPSHDAHIPKWEGGTAVVYFDNGWKIPLPSLLACCIPPGPLEYIFLPAALSWESSAESHSAGWSTLGCSGRSLDRKRSRFFFSRMYIKASHASGGISSGNRRDSPHEQDDDIVFIVFLFFPLDLQPPSRLFKPPC